MATIHVLNFEWPKATLLIKQVYTKRVINIFVFQKMLIKNTHSSYNLNRKQNNNVIFYVVLES